MKTIAEPACAPAAIQGRDTTGSARPTPDAAMLKKPLQQLFALSSMFQQSEEPVSGLDLPPAAATADELTAAKQMHYDWHHRLVAYLLGRSQEELRPEELCFADRCEFGRWLELTGPDRLGRQAYNALNRHNEMVHLQAANVVSFHRAGQRTRARELFKTSYADASRALLATLNQLGARNLTTPAVPKPGQGDSRPTA